MAKAPSKKTKVSKEKEIDEAIDKASKPEKVVKTKDILSVLVKINETPFEFTCNTTEEVMAGILGLNKDLLKTRLVVQVTKDGKTLDRLLQLQEAKRLFYNKVAQEMFVKHLTF